MLLEMSHFVLSDLSTPARSHLAASRLIRGVFSHPGPAFLSVSQQIRSLCNVRQDWTACKDFSSETHGNHVLSISVPSSSSRRVPPPESGILIVFQGSAVGHNGRSATLTAPNGTSQRATIAAALRDARVSAKEVCVCGVVQRCFPRIIAMVTRNILSCSFGEDGFVG